MNRVTKTERIAGHTVHYISDNDIFEITGCPGKITGFPILRLSAYEDTGLEPEEIIALCDMDRRAKIADMLRLEESAGISTDRLRELAQAEKEGRLLVLTDVKYTDSDGDKALRHAMYMCGVQNNPVTRYTADAIAEKLTREAAEAALEEMGAQ